MSSKPSATLARLAQTESKRTTSVVRDIQEQLDAALVGGNDPDDGSLSLPGQVTETMLALPPGLTFEQWQKVGFTLRRINRSWRWWVGDWLTYGERAYGEMYSQAMDETGIDYNQLAQIAHVARRITPEMRHESLSWSHHAAVAKLEPEQATALLDKAESDGWKREHLRAAATLLMGGKQIMPAETLQTLCGCHCHAEVCVECSKPIGSLE